MGQLIAVAVHLAGEDERGQPTNDHREHTELVDPQDRDSLSAPFGKLLATEAEDFDWVDAEKAGDERRRALHAAAMLGQMAPSNASDSDRDQSDNREQIDQGGGPEGEAGVHRVSIETGGGSIAVSPLASGGGSLPSAPVFSDP